MDRLESGSRMVFPFGHGASMLGAEEDMEDDDDMDLDRSPLDLPDTLDNERAASPASSYASMDSDSMDCGTSNIIPEDIATSIELERPDSALSSVYSLESDEDVNVEMKAELRIRKKPSTLGKGSTGHRTGKVPSVCRKHPALTLQFAFQFLQQVLKKLSEAQLKFFRKYLWENFPEHFSEPLERLDLLDLVDKILENCGVVESINITAHVIDSMGFIKREEDYIKGHLLRNEARYHLKEQLLEQYKTFHDGCPNEGQVVDFESAYTEHFLTLGVYAPLNEEHEVRQPEDEKVNFKPVKKEDICDIKKLKRISLNAIVLRGVAGVGKTVAAQRLILDWALGKAHQHIYFLFPMSGIKLYAMLDKETTFLELIISWFPCMKDIDNLDFEDCRVMFILDDMDELLNDLDLLYTHNFSSETCKLPLRDLLINLVKGHLLSRSLVFMLGRTYSVTKLSHERVDQVIEVRGFAETEREEYFRRRHSNDPTLAERMVAYVRKNKTLFIMCHLPMFCWVVSKYLQEVFQRFPPGQEPPTTITELYTRLVVVYLKIRDQRQKNHCLKGEKWEDVIKLLVSVSKLAYDMLDKNLLCITQNDWEKENIDPREAIDRCGLCMEYIRERYILYVESVRGFLHGTMLEYMAALYMLYTFRAQGKNLMSSGMMNKLKVRSQSLTDLFRSVMDKAAHLKEQDSHHYDLFLRFLAGLAAEPSQRSLCEFLPLGKSKSSEIEEATKFFRKRIRENPNKTGNLEKCIDELNHKGL